MAGTQPDVGPVLARLVRNGVVESLHAGAVVVCDTDGTVLAAVGDPRRQTYVRSAAKPFQSLGTLDVLTAAGKDLDVDGLAIACASHDGSDEHQIEAARLLAEAELDEAALRCPPAMPRDADTAWQQRWPYPLSHNCSGKHAAFLYATAASGGDTATYLSVDSPLQVRVRERLEEVCGAAPSGPGIDGCGAPAWVLPLHALATGFARLAAAAEPALERVRDAMTARPDLIGGRAAVDTRLMQGDGRIVAKRGAEAVFAAGVSGRGTSLGVAVKVSDGGDRADGPIAAAVLQQLGCAVADDLLEPAVLGGGRPQGSLRVVDEVRSLLTHR